MASLSPKIEHPIPNTVPLPMGDSLTLARQATAKDQVKPTSHLAWNLGTIFVVEIMETNFGSKQILVPRNETILKGELLRHGDIYKTRA